MGKKGVYEFRAGWLDRYCAAAGGVEKFAEMVGKNPKFFSAIRGRKKNMGSSVARDIEAAMVARYPSYRSNIEGLFDTDPNLVFGETGAVSVPRKLPLFPALPAPKQNDSGNAPGFVPPGEIGEGYVRFHLYEGGAGMGNGVVNADYPEVIRQVDMAEWEVRRKLGFLPKEGRIQLITWRGPSMSPLIEDGDVLMVDVSVTGFDCDGVYLINLGGETLIKMLQARSDGVYVVSANAAYPAHKPERGEIHVGGKIVGGMGLKRL